VARTSALRPVYAPGRVALRTDARTRPQTQAAPAPRRRPNPLALVPYMIGLLMFALMAVVYV